MEDFTNGMGFEPSTPICYHKLKKEAISTIEQFIAGRPKVEKFWQMVKKDPEVNANWDMDFYVSVWRLRYNDHGDSHALIVASNSLKILKCLLKHKVIGAMIKTNVWDEDDAYLVLLAASLFHDFGNLVHRENHNLFSVFLARPILDRLLPQIYQDLEEAYEIRNLILNCIYAHTSTVEPLIEEAAVLGIADATDNTKGRAKNAFERGNVNVHTVSALSVNNTEIQEGKKTPVEIIIEMNNAEGAIFQLESLIAKIRKSSLRDYFDIVATTKIHPTEKRVREIRVKENSIVVVRN